MPIMRHGPPTIIAQNTDRIVSFPLILHRRPNIATQFNFADCIESGLKEDGHRIWGFVIYRCDYESDDDWKEFMARLQYRIKDELEYYNGLELLDSLAITVFDDKSLFDDASTTTVREHFDNWSATAPEKEQGTGEGNAQRYRYCIQVDAASLESVVKDAPAPPATDTTCDGFVNLIWRYWEPHSPDPRDAPQSPIEGCTEDDVGWMMVAYCTKMSWWGWRTISVIEVPGIGNTDVLPK